jgi:hypothetical protein
MKIVRKSEQRTLTRSADNREVRFIFSEPVQPYDWLVATHSQQCPESKDDVAVDFHSHPNALELILFQKAGSLVIGGTPHDFEPGDLVILEPQDIHGAKESSEHDCICILLGKGEPQKDSLRERKYW